MQTNLDIKDLLYRNCEEKPFRIYGVFRENGKFRRIPEKVATQLNEEAYKGHARASGGRIRFKTDSQYIAINAELYDMTKVCYAHVLATAGFDIYVKKNGEHIFEGIFVPPSTVLETNKYEGCIRFPNKELREITLNLPYRASVAELYIGLQETATLLPADDYTYEKPVVYYGSSITQGITSSRVGNTYPAIVSRLLDTNYINLGFGGGARGEDAIAEYIKNLDMSVFVLDYDHNAVSAEELEQTHEKMFKTIREANPNLPIIIMPRPNYTLSKAQQERFEIIKRTYDNALKNGDQNVYFIDNKTLMSLARYDGIADGIHPNDLGFYSMAKAIEPVLKKILK